MMSARLSIVLMAFGCFLAWVGRIGGIAPERKGDPGLDREAKKMAAKTERARDFFIWLYSLIFTCTHLCQTQLGRAELQQAAD
jgi:hypothetical protein